MKLKQVFSAVFLTISIVPAELLADSSQAMKIGLKPVLNDSAIGVGYKTENLVAQGYLSANGDYFVGVGIQHSILRGFDAKAGMGFGEINDAKISAEDELKNPVLPLGINAPKYDYHISKNYFGVFTSISSSWLIHEKIIIDIEWISISVPIAYFGSENRDGVIPYGKRFDQKLSNWSFLLSMGYEI